MGNTCICGGNTIWKGEVINGAEVRIWVNGKCLILRRVNFKGNAFGAIWGYYNGVGCFGSKTFWESVLGWAALSNAKTFFSRINDKWGLGKEV